uniref:DUF4283 domain-containing protein n=1 Tax=Cannabis sativa TaxID=3483 RepID=A0A803PQ90_CANSA
MLCLIFYDEYGMFCGGLNRKTKVKIEFEDIAEEVNYWQPSLVCYVIGANPPVNILDGFLRRIWKDAVVKVGLLAKGIFIIKFQNLEMRDKIMEQGYVFFDRKVMKPWNSVDDFTKSHLHCQLGSGRIIVAWQPSAYSVDIKYCSSQLVHCYIHSMKQNEKFFVTFIYGFNDEQKREELWGNLEKLATGIQEPWIILGDFNEILYANERVGRKAQSNPSQRLRDCMELCEITDLKFSGSFLTWNNKQKPDDRIFSKIDRAMVNPQWSCSFPNSKAVFLPKLSFDHIPILVSIYQDWSSRKKPFRYYNMWKLAPDFDAKVIQCWNEDVKG